MSNGVAAFLGVAVCFVFFALGQCPPSVIDLSYDMTDAGADGSGGAGGSGGGDAGTGGALVCTPGATASCYDGPAGTEGQGLCKAGTQVCATDGMSWGACTGDVLPKAEDCATPEDEDCDGLAPACKGKLLWAEMFGDAQDQIAFAVAVDGGGNAVIAGSFSGTIDFGGGELTSGGTQDVFIAKLDPDGGHVWSKRYGDARA